MPDRYMMTCPYCFGEPFADTEVMFRSEYWTNEDAALAALPEDYEDLEEFLARYRGADKEEILKRYHDLEFFVAGEDEEYEKFWTKYEGTTEVNPADKDLGVLAYQRPILDPNNPQHQRHLQVQPDGGYFIYDAEGMAVQIRLTSGERCGRRVCPHCHNPLPENYGKNPAKFISVIGVTGSGKTVYLSQLLYRMGTYATKAGLVAITTLPSVQEFVNNNRIVAGQPVPGSTPKGRFQQPLFYELIQKKTGDSLRTETMVLYDVPGEALTNPQLVTKFAPFVEEVDAAILLIDPLQFKDIQALKPDAKRLEEATTVLRQIHFLICKDGSKQCEIPIAVCLAKSDEHAVMSALKPELQAYLRDDYQPIRARNGFALPLFNAERYNPAFQGLYEFIQEKDPNLAALMHINYANYGYFAFTALGCDVANKLDENGNVLYQYPVGPVLPKHVEEPLLWLFYQLGYIDVNVPIKNPAEDPIYCPECGSDNIRKLPDGSTMTIGHWWNRQTVEVNQECLACNTKWLELPQN